MKKPKKLKKYIAYGILMILLYIIETMPQGSVNNGIYSPELMLPLVTVFALFEGEKFGAVTGLLAGILYDAQGGGLTGFHAILFMFFGYFTGLLLIFLLRRNIVTAVALSGFWVLVSNYLFYFFFYYMFGDLRFSYATLKVILPKTAVSVIASIFIYLLILFIYNKFPEKADSEAAKE